MKRVLHHLTLLLLLTTFLSACQQNSTDSNNSSVNNTGEAQAIALDGTQLFPPKDSPAEKSKKDSLLQVAKANYESNPNSLHNIVWYGRRTAYLAKYKEAIEIYTKGLEKFPNSPELYRHRGHRYISIRQFDNAIADFEKAGELSVNRAVITEADGIPNKLNKPLSNLQFNIWYHWALTYYLKGNFEKAIELYNICMQYSNNPDLLCATSDWLYMAYMRAGDPHNAAFVLENISPEMEIIENTAYHNRLLFYKGLKEATDLLDLENPNPDDQIQIVTQGYGVGNWYLYNHQKDKAQEIFQKVLASDYWPAFGYIAAEADLYRMNNQ